MLSYVRFGTPVSNSHDRTETELRAGRAVHARGRRGNINNETNKNESEGRNEREGGNSRAEPTTESKEATATAQKKVTMTHPQIEHYAKKVDAFIAKYPTITQYGKQRID